MDYTNYTKNFKSCTPGRIARVPIPYKYQSEILKDYNPVERYRNMPSLSGDKIDKLHASIDLLACLVDKGGNKTEMAIVLQYMSAIAHSSIANIDLEEAALSLGLITLCEKYMSEEVKHNEKDSL